MQDARLAIRAHAALLILCAAAAWACGGAGALWTTSLGSGHDGVQHFRVAVEPFTAHPITDNPIRYGRVLYPLAAHVLGSAGSVLAPATVVVPHLEGERDGRFLSTAISLLAIAILFGFLTVAEAARALGSRGALLVAVCPVLLLAELHCLAFPILAWGTFRFLRRWSEGANPMELTATAAALCLVHPSALVLPVAYAVEPWLARRGPRACAERALLGVAAMLPVVAWHVFLAIHLETGLGAGSSEYGSAALALVPGRGLVQGLMANVTAFAEELRESDVLSAGARIARYGLLVAGTLLLVAHPWVAARRQSGTEALRRIQLAYWLPVVALVTFAGVQVASDLDNLGRLVFASPLCYATWLALPRADAPRTQRWLLGLALLVFLAVDVNYVASFLGKVLRG